MLSSNNILSPAHGAPLATPTQDMVLGIYFITYGADEEELAKLDEELKSGAGKIDGKVVRSFRSAQEAELAFENEHRQAARLRRVPAGRPRALPDHGRADHLQRPDRASARRGARGRVGSRRSSSSSTTALKKRDVNDMVTQLVEAYGAAAVSLVLDAFKELGFHFATQAGITISKNDVISPPNKEEILDGYEKRAAEIASPVRGGLDHRRGAQGSGRVAVERGDRRRRTGDGGQPRRAQPDLHDGQLRRPWIVQADPPAGRHARPDGESEGRDHRAADQVQLHGGPDRLRVLHLDPRRP